MGIGGGGVLGSADTAVMGVVLAAGAVGTALIWARGLWRLGEGSGERGGLAGELVLLCGVMIWLGQQLGGGSAVELLGLEVGTMRGLGLMGLGGGVGAGLGFAAGWIATRGMVRRIIRGVRGSDLGAGLGWGILSVGVVLTVGVAAQFIAGLILKETPDALAHEALALLVDREGAMGGWWWLAIGYVVVIAPVVEEVIFRGFVQEGLGRWLGGRRWVAILGTSVVFALIHIPSVDGQALVPLFVLSCLLGVVRERTGGVWAGVIVHGIFNAANIGMALAG